MDFKSFKRCLATSLALHVLQGHAIGQIVIPSIATSKYLNPPFRGSSIKVYLQYLSRSRLARKMGFVVHCGAA